MSSSDTTTIDSPLRATFTASRSSVATGSPSPRRAPAVSRRPAPSLLKRLNPGVVVAFLLPAAIFGLWLLAVDQKWAPPILLPAPSAVLNTGLDLFADGLLLNDFWTSLRIVLQGFFWGSVTGLTLGAYAGLSKWVERFFGPTFDAIRQVPPLALLPLIVLWVGIGDLGKIILISKVVFFPIFLNTLQGIRGVQREFVEVGTVFKLTRWQFVRKIIIPGALPSILVGVRYAAGMSWASIVGAEMISGHSGLGYLIQRSQDLLFTSQLFVAIVVIALFGLFIDRTLRALERHLLRWKQGYTG